MSGASMASSSRAKSAAPPNRARRTPRTTTSARNVRLGLKDGGDDAAAEDEVADATAEAEAAAQLAAIERIIPVDFRPSGLPSRIPSHFCVEDDVACSTLKHWLDVVMVTEVNEGDPVIVYASDGFSDLSGFPVEEIVTLSPGTVLLDTGDDEGSESLRVALTSDAPSSTALKAISKSGTKFDLHVFSAPLQDGAGEVSYHISILMDSRGLQALSDSSKSITLPPTPGKLASMIEAVLMTSNDSEEQDAPVKEASAESLETLGYRETQLIGHSFLALCGPETDRMTKEAFLLGHMDQKATLKKVLMYRGNGHPFWAMVLSVPLTRSSSPRKGKSLIRKREGSHAHPRQTNLREVKPMLRSGNNNCSSHLCILFDVSRKQLKRIGKWTMGKVIGKGAQGVVRLGKTDKGEILAIKMVDASNFRNIRDIDRLQDEIHVLVKLKHKNIIRLVDTYFYNNAFYFAMEWASGGSLVDYMRSQDTDHLQEDDARQIFHQIVEALDYCHRRRVVHRDLKPENVLMDENHVVKIADFGLAAITAPFNEGLTLMCGTPEFTAPEIVSGREYDGASVDIWSLGVMLFELVAGFLPFRAKDQKELFKNIVKGQPARMPSHVSLEADDLIKNMLQKSPEDRISLDAIQNHPWYLGKGRKKDDRVKPILHPSAPTHQSIQLIIPSDDPFLSSALDSSGRRASGSMSRNDSADHLSGSPGAVSALRRTTSSPSGALSSAVKVAEEAQEAAAALKALDPATASTRRKLSLPPGGTNTLGGRTPASPYGKSPSFRSRARPAMHKAPSKD